MRVTLRDAISLFRQHGFDLLLAETGIESARADEMSARAVPNPAVGATIGKSFTYDPHACAGCSEIAWSAALSDQGALVNWISGKRHLRIEVARAALEAAKMSREDARRTLEFSVKQQYADAALAQASLDLARQAGALAAQTVDLVGVRYRAGAVSEADLARAQAAKLETDQAVDIAALTLRTAKVTLAFLMGARAPSDFEIDAQTLRRRAPAALAALSQDDLLRLAAQHRPDLRVAELQRDRAASSIALNKRQRFPDIALSAQYSQQGTGQNAIQPPTITVGLSAPLPLFYQYQGEIAKAEADLHAGVVQLERAQGRVAAEVQIARATYASTLSRVNRMESQLLERVTRARELVEVQYQKGAASLLELLDAQRTFLATNAEYLQNLNDYWTAVFSLEQAVGAELAP